MARLKEIQHHSSNIKRNMVIMKYDYKTCHIEGKINIHTTPHCFMILSLHYYNNERNFSGNNFSFRCMRFTLKRASIPVKLSVQHYYLDIFNPSHKIRLFKNSIGIICYLIYA